MAYCYTWIRSVWHTYSQQICIFFLSLSYHSRRHLRSLRRFLILHGPCLQNILKCAGWFVYRGQSFGFFNGFLCLILLCYLTLGQNTSICFHFLNLFWVIWFCGHLDPPPFLLVIFTICFKETISKLFGRLHFEWRCYPVTVLRRQVTFRILYCLLL
jgi:hypothetical protein